MSVWTDYAKHVQSLDRDTWLGMLTWYTVAQDLQVPQAAVAAALTNAGLSHHVPPAPHNSDVFRRTCSAAQRKRVPTADPDIFENFLVRDPGSDPNFIHRHVIREQVDGANKRLGYTTVAEIRFDKSTGAVTHQLATDPIAEEICRQVHDHYAAERGCLNGYAVRELIRRVLLGANATNVRYPGGGVYFLSADHAITVAGLEEMADALGDKVSLHVLPLLDDRKQRDMLKKAFEAESIDRAQALVTEIAELRRAGRKISTEKYATYVTALNELKAKLGEYSALLETGLSSTESSLQILQRQVIGLMADVER
jgi:hypothetical protein